MGWDSLKSDVLKRNTVCGTKGLSSDTGSAPDAANILFL